MVFVRKDYSNFIILLKQQCNHCPSEKMGENHDHSGHNMILLYFFGPFVGYCCLCQIWNLVYRCFCKHNESASIEMEKKDDLLKVEIRREEDETRLKVNEDEFISKDNVL